MKRILPFLILLLLPNISLAGINQSYYSVGISNNEYNSKVNSFSTSGNNIVGAAANISTPSSDISSSNQSASFAISKHLSLNNLSLLGLNLSSRQFKKIFLNYEGFLDLLNSSESIRGSVNVNNNNINLPVNINLKNRYGFKIGLGYAFNDTVSIYSNIGISSLDYELDNRGNAQTNNNGNPNGTTNNNRTLDAIFSLGAIYNLYNYFNIGFEYSIQDSNLESADYSFAGVGGVNTFSFDTKIESYTLKFSKKF